MRSEKNAAEPMGFADPYATTFAKFPAWQGMVSAGCIARSTGAVARIDRLYPGPYIAKLQEEALRSRHVHTKHPGLADPNYLELGAILMAVDSAQGGFAMMELGAGTGPWTAQAACAAAARALRPRHFLAVEAEPERFVWLKDNLLQNAILPSEMDLVHAAVLPKSKHAMQVLFPVGTPLFAGWGAQTSGGRGSSREINYAGRTENARLEPSPVVSLLGLLIRSKHIYDIAHIDIQGAELEVLEEAAQVLASRLRAVAVGTHGDAVAKQLAKLFSGLGWRCIVAVDGNSSYDVNGTKVSTKGLDGFQHWVNPTL
jgi:FkbM family methyltransferase